MVAHRRKDEANPSARRPSSEPTRRRFPLENHDKDEDVVRHALHDLVETLERMARNDIERRIDKWAADTAKHLADHRDHRSDPSR